MKKKKDVIQIDEKVYFTEKEHRQMDSFSHKTALIGKERLIIDLKKEVLDGIIRENQLKLQLSDSQKKELNVKEKELEKSYKEFIATVKSRLEIKDDTTLRFDPITGELEF